MEIYDIKKLLEENEKRLSKIKEYL